MPWFESRYPSHFYYEPLAQLVEHLTFNQRVEGSNPSWLIFKFLAPVQRGDLAQLGERVAGSDEVRGSSPLGSIVPCVFVLSMCKKAVSINLDTAFF